MPFGGPTFRRPLAPIIRETSEKQWVVCSTGVGLAWGWVRLVVPPPVEGVRSQSPAFGAGDVVDCRLEFWLGQIWGLEELELGLWLGLVLELGLELEG